LLRRIRDLFSKPVGVRACFLKLAFEPGICRVFTALRFEAEVVGGDLRALVVGEEAALAFGNAACGLGLEAQPVADGGFVLRTVDAAVALSCFDCALDRGFAGAGGVVAAGAENGVGDGARRGGIGLGVRIFLEGALDAAFVELGEAVLERGLAILRVERAGAGVDLGLAVAAGAALGAPGIDGVAAGLGELVGVAPDQRLRERVLGLVAMAGSS